MTSLLTSCLQEEANAIYATAEKLNEKQVALAIEELLACYARKAKLLVTGVGKSGIVARKIAATFSSIGLTSIFLNPLDALHGDLGIVNQDDIILLLSNSGETEELVAILPHLKRRGTICMAIVGRISSTVASRCDVVLDGSVDREVCPLNLAPTASTAVAMAIGDALAAVWMEKAGILPSDFAINHPAGSLGRQLTLTVDDLMIPVKDIQPISPEATLADVISHLTAGTYSRGSIGAAWVENNQGGMGGLITDGDLRRALQRFGPEEWSLITAIEMATPNPITIDSGALAAEAIKLMESNHKKPVSVLPVVDSSDSGQIIGLIRLHDLVQAGFQQSQFS